MKIYQIVFESDKFQYVYHKNRRLRMTSIILEGKSRVGIWPDNLEFEIEKPNRPRGIFFQWSSSELILTCEAQADEKLVSLLTVNGEFLPVRVEGEQLQLHNIISFSDCVDHTRSRFKAPTVAIPHQLLYPFFDSSKVPLGVHFRLREYPGPRYVATDPSLPPEKDFYQWYHKQGYKGLEFRLLWDSEKPDELIRFY